MTRTAVMLETFSRDLLEAMPDAGFLVNSAGTLVLINALAETMFGYESQELRGRSIDSLVPERFRRVHAHHCTEYFAHPRTRAMGVGLPLYALHKDGTEFPVEISLRPIDTDAGTYVLGAIRDISQSEQRYRAIFEQVAVGVAHATAEGQLLNVNRKFCEITGYTRAEALALTIRDLTHPDHLETSLAERARMLAGLASDHAREVRLLHKDGSEIWTHITTSLVRGGDGRPVHFISVIHDISQQKEADLQRRETDHRFRQVTDNIREVFWLTDPAQHDILYVSPAYETIWGRSLEALYASPRMWLEAIHPEDRDRVLVASQAWPTTSTYDEEYRIVRPDGNVRWIRDRAFPVQDEDGRLIRIAGVAEDITERKLAADELRESEARFRAMIEQSISGTCIIDTDRRFVYVNPRLAAILGYESAGSMTGRPVLEFVAPEDRSLVTEQIRQPLEGESSGARYQFQALRRDGSRVTLGTHGSMGWYGGKRVLIATAQDVTELRRAEEEIERHVAKLQRAMQSTIEVVSTMGELRDPYTQGHEHRVGEIATAIATEMGLLPDQIEGIRVAGYLHDVGKIAVPAEILSKPRRLSTVEYELVKQHAQQSYETLKSTEFPWPVAEVAWQHHERLDGSGYPRGLKGEAIIFEVRIVAVADVVEAMASHRPYRPGLGLEAALTELERYRGKRYDPTVVDACLQLFRVKEYQLPE